MIQEMKGEIGAISRRGFRSQPHRPGRVRRVAAVEPVEAALRQSCWAQLPPELLREVLARVEDAEARWPGRRDVVACAGVCRSWRGVVKEIVRTPEVSGKLTFPISLKQVWFSESHVHVVDCANFVLQFHTLLIFRIKFPPKKYRIDILSYGQSFSHLSND
jgi:hypothetical protein